MLRKGIIICKPKMEDAVKIYNLVKDTKVLDLNSEYLYLLQTTHFRDFCSIAISGDKLIGFVSGYMIPNENGILFIWQVAIDSDFRGNDLARRLILNIIKNNSLNIKYLHTTVSPSNKASLRVFEKVAQYYHTNISSHKYFEANNFSKIHEEEVLYKIGPINKIKEDK